MPHFHGVTQLLVITLFVWLITGATRLIALSYPESRLSHTFVTLNG